MSLPSQTLVINGWTIFAHPLFLDTLEALTAQLAALRQGAFKIGQPTFFRNTHHSNSPCALPTASIFLGLHA